MTTTVRIGQNPTGSVYIGPQNATAGVGISAWSPAGNKRSNQLGTFLTGANFGTGTADVFISDDPDPVANGVLQPTPLSVTDSQINLAPLDLTGIPDGTIYIAVRVPAGAGNPQSNVVSDTKQENEASGTLTAQAATTSGTAFRREVRTGTGALTGQASTTAGTAFLNPSAPKTVTGTGTLTAQAATTVGDADRVIYQSGAVVRLNPDNATVSGVGDVSALKSGTGVLQSQNSSTSGLAQKIAVKTGLGVLTAEVSTLSGTGNKTSIKTGDGTLTAVAATVGGDGFKITTKEGTGTLTGQNATTSGLANKTKSVTGSGLLIPAPATAIGGGTAISPSQTITIPVPEVLPYTTAPGSRYTLTIPGILTQIQFRWSSDDPEYINGNLSVEIALIHTTQGRVPLCSLNNVSQPTFILYDAQGADTLDRFALLVDELLDGQATIEITGYDDLGTEVVPFAQDGGLAIHNVSLVA